MEEEKEVREGVCDRACRLINESRSYPGERAFRASSIGSGKFLVLLRDKANGNVRQIEWKEEK